MENILEEYNDKFIYENIANELNLELSQIVNTVKLFDEGSTIPFISRYRKEMTKNLDEEKITEIVEKTEYYRNLEKRKQEVIRLIDEQGKLTDELKNNILNSKKLQEVEDLYMPFKKKKKTKADIAIEKGLEPLVIEFLTNSINIEKLNEISNKYITEEVLSVDEAIDGLKLIIAQYLSENIPIREYLRTYIFENANLKSLFIEKNKELDPKQVYKDYYNFSEKVSKLPSYRILAIQRAEKEKILKTSFELEDVIYSNMKEEIYKISFLNELNSIKITNENILNKENNVYTFIDSIIEDSLKRLLLPSIENEINSILKENAEKDAIVNFSKNLKNLLLQPPLDKKTIMGLDPGYRTGCKMAIIDKDGFYQENNVLYLVKEMHTEKQLKNAKDLIIKMIDKYDVDIIAIGNGTASRETEAFVAETLSEYTKKDVSYVIVNEAGASVYSASKLASEEFPDLDVTVRGTISIARRLQDPLSELVKIDPKSIGVGMYQHDVNQKKLQESLTLAIESIVNKVGVNVNTASFELLSYVSGINKKVAKNIELYRKDNGDFSNRNELKKVKGLGDKIYEQMIGFIVVPNSINPLDNTIIHPESYHIAETILNVCGSNIDEYKNDILKSREKLSSIKIKDIVNEYNFGYETTVDVLKALKEDRRDPRDFIEKPILRKDILKIEDLQEGMIVEGTVRNVMPFGAFVDIGLKNMALLHISEVSNKFIKNLTDVISIGQIIKAKIISIEIDRERINLSMKKM